MNTFKLGTNFDISLLDRIDTANKMHKQSKVAEIYGSIRRHAALAARPDFRLPDVSLDAFEEYVQYARDRGIMFEYTFNSINPYGSKVEVANNMQHIRAIVRYLNDVGVYRISIANPMLLEIISPMVDRPKLELSTVAHIDTVTQIKYYNETYDVTKFCVNLNKNRNFKWLKAAAKYCNEHNIELEVMANEFCGVGGKTYATHCIYRDSCYLCHSTNKTIEDVDLINSYPMRQCTHSRNENPANWLKMRFIRPEDLHYYNDIGITQFKLTGRTGSTEYLIKVLNAYMTGKWEGNLLGLWKPLESITHDKTETFAPFYIDNQALEGFMQYFASGHDCDNEVCGETCRYCDKFYANIDKKSLKPEDYLE